MKYYIFQYNWDLNLLTSEEPLWAYNRKSINLGERIKDIPKVTLDFRSKTLPDAIPNVNLHFVFNQKIISALKDAGADYVQYFDIDASDKTGKVVSGDYKCLNILKVIDAIDFRKSEFKWSDLEEGETEEDRIIMRVIDLRLDYTKINDEPLFLLKGCANLLVFRKDLALFITNKKYTGLEFYPAEGYNS